MKIILISAAGKKYKEAAEFGKPYRYYAPTTLIQLAALVPPECNAEIEVFDQGIEKIPDNLNADLIGISAITCAAEQAYALAAKARQRGITVVMGGFHASAVPEEALRYADSVVIGYAEQTWPRLLFDFQHNKLKKIYRQKKFRASITIPPLDRSLHRGKRYLVTDTIEATRGCSNKCEFCVIPPYTSYGITSRPVGEVILEIEGMGKNILFFDSNTVTGSQYESELWNNLVPLKKNWFGNATLQLADDDELLRLAIKSGCKGILVGFESINQRSLDGVNKGFNLVSSYREKIKKLHDHGLGILGAFVFGFDDDDTSIFERTVEFVIKNKIDAVKYSILTPLPGTPLYNRLHRSRRINSDNWNLYDADHCVFQPALMSPDRLEQGLRWAYLNTYSFSAIARRIRWDSSMRLSLPINLAFRMIEG